MPLDTTAGAGASKAVSSPVFLPGPPYTDCPLLKETSIGRIENSPGRCRGRGLLPTRAERLDQRHTRGKSLSGELDHTLLVRQCRRLCRDHIEVLFNTGLVTVVRDVQCALRRGQRRILFVELR